MATAYDGGAVALIHPQRIGEFIRIHASTTLIMHNAAFDYPVVRQYLLQCGAQSEPQIWEDFVDQGRVADTMLLDQLIGVARGTTIAKARDLAVVADAWANIGDLDKSESYRLRYGEIIGKEWKDVDPGFWHYAVKDPIATYMAYQKMKRVAKSIVSEQQVDPSGRKAYGLLTQKIQVKAACALAYVTHAGIYLDHDRRDATEQALRSDIENLVRQIESSRGHGIFKRYKKSGEYRLTPNGVPCVDNKRVSEILAQIASTHELTVPATSKSKKPTLSRSFWKQHSELDEFIAPWVRLDELKKLNQFFANLKSERVHPRYSTVVRTGRVSCHGPNIQQISRNSDFREIFVASPGSMLLILDYAAIELRTLAAVCEDRFGGSTLADTIRQGIDPHEYTAALLLGINLNEFQELKKTEPKQFKQYRQQAKTLNFGLPGGLAAPALVSYAKSTYGVEMTGEQAEEFRHQFLNTIFPEIGEYLQSDTATILARNLKTTRRSVMRTFETEPVILAAKRIVRGNCNKRSGGAYRDSFIDRVWSGLEKLNQNPELDDALTDRKTSNELERSLFLGTLTTLTGRVRGQATYTQRCNTPFQGLASDGCKLALWELHKAEYRVIAFVHDEFVVELPKDADWTAEAKRIDRICCDSMETVTGTVPIQCEYALSHNWSKDAEAVWDENGRLIPWQRETESVEFTSSRLSLADSDGSTTSNLQTLIDDRRTYGTIYADPPWQYANKGTRVAADKQYATMSLALKQAKAW